MVRDLGAALQAAAILAARDAVQDEDAETRVGRVVVLLREMEKQGIVPEGAAPPKAPDPGSNLVPRTGRQATRAKADGGVGRTPA